jgi:hypothetical protein
MTVASAEAGARAGSDDCAAALRSDAARNRSPTWRWRTVVPQAKDRGFTDVLPRAFPDDPSLQADRARGFRALPALIRAAKAAGRLRPSSRQRTR